MTRLLVWLITILFYSDYFSQPSQKSKSRVCTVSVTGRYDLDTVLCSVSGTVCDGSQF